MSDDEIGCCFPGECCMPGEHFKSECHTAEMIGDVRPDPPQRIRLWWDSGSREWRLSWQLNATSDKPEYVLVPSSSTKRKED